jgi:hypothetical protein
MKAEDWLDAKLFGILYGEVVTAVQESTMSKETILLVLKAVYEMTEPLDFDYIRAERKNRETH